MGIEISITDQTVSIAAEHGLDPQFRARPEKRVIQREILNELSTKILVGAFSRDSKILADVAGGPLYSLFKGEHHDYPDLEDKFIVNILVIPIG